MRAIAAQDDALIAQAVAEVVRRQVDIGIDIVSDGEMSKISYATYVAERFTGFAGDTPREAGQDLVDFPGLLRKLADRGATAKYRRPRCVGDIKVRNTAPAGDRHPQPQCGERRRLPGRGVHECGLARGSSLFFSRMIITARRMNIWKPSRRPCRPNTRPS